MLFLAILSSLLIIFFWILFKEYQLEKNQYQMKKKELTAEVDQLKKEESILEEKINKFDQETAQFFTFYDATRLVATLFNKQEMTAAFIEKINSMGEVERVSLSPLQGPDCHRFRIEENKGYLYIDTKSTNIFGLIPLFAKLFNISLQRLNLYGHLQKLSIRDQLTGVYNRRFFEKRVEEEFLRSEKLKNNLSFLMLDIDDFKKINDTYGHLTGDAVLKRAAALILEGVREIDFVGRLGGEEFGMLLTDTDKAGAIMVSERICSRISQEKIKVFDESLSITVSIGISTYPSNTIYLDLFTEIADKALYRAKDSGKDRVCWF